MVNGIDLSTFLARAGCGQGGGRVEWSLGLDWFGLGLLGRGLVTGAWDWAGGLDWDGGFWTGIWEGYWGLWPGSLGVWDWDKGWALGLIMDWNCLWTDH